MVTHANLLGHGENINQRDKGYCAFAAVLMHYFDLGLAGIGQLEAAISGMANFPVNAPHMALAAGDLMNRVGKRMYLLHAGGGYRYRPTHTLRNYLGLAAHAPITPALRANLEYDLMLAYGLMILFKHAVVHSGNAHLRQLWKDTETFSKILAPTWQHGTKLSQVRENGCIFGRKQRPRGFAGNPGMSYKHGDIGLTVDATKELIKFALGTQNNIVYHQLLNPTDLKRGVPDFSYLNELRTKIVPGFRGAIVSMAGGTTNPKLENYNYLGHWLYVPQYQAAFGTPAIVYNMRIWNWGEERTLQNWYQRQPNQSDLIGLFPTGYYLLP